jgi:translation initiation factor IF-3
MESPHINYEYCKASLFRINEREIIRINEAKYSPKINKHDLESK